MRITILSAAIILILSSHTTKSVAFSEQPDTLTILHVNDTHSYLLPYGSKDITGKGQRGGIARVATLIKDVKATEKHVLFLHAGDLFVGDFMFNKYLGVAEFEILKSLGCNAMTIGNHEFDLTPAVLESSLAAAGLPDSHFSILSANLDLSGYPSLTQFIRPYVIKNIGSIRVGIFGLTTELTNLISYPEPVVVDTALYAAQAWVDTLKNHGCNLIILLSHLGIVSDSSIAAAVSGIDLIVGGHSHTTIFQPIKVATPTGDTTLIVQAASHYAYLGNLKLVVGNDRIQSWTYELIRIDDTVTEDPVIASMVQTYVGDLQADPSYGNVYTDVIAQAAVHMTNAIGIGPYKDTPIGNMVSDAFRSKTGTDIAFEPQGLTSSNLFAGDLVGADIFQLVPYGYDSLSGLGFKLVTFDIRGLFLITLLEASLLYWPDLKDALLHTSGMSYSFNSSSIPGTRINLSSVRVGGNPISILRTYSVTVTEGFMAALNRASDVINIPIANVETTAYFEYNVVRDFICANSPIEYYVEGRVTEVGMILSPTLAQEPPYTQGLENTLYWTSTGVEYICECSFSPNFTTVFQTSGWTSNTSYTFRWLTDGTKYYYRVKAKNTTGLKSDWSNVVSSTQDATAPGTPAVLLPIGDVYLNDSLVVFCWTAIVEDTTCSPVEYILQVDTEISFASPIVDTLISNSDTLVLVDGNYYWRVKAYDLAGNKGVFSNPDSFVVDITPPDIPALVSPPAGLATNNPIPTFIWNAPLDNLSGIEHYTLQYADNPDSLGASYIIVADTTYMPTSLSDTIYYWRVKAFDRATNQSDWSEVWNFEIDTRTPSVPTLVSPQDSSYLGDTIVVFEWTEVIFKGQENYSRMGSASSPVRYILQVDTFSLFVDPFYIDTVVYSMATVNIKEGQYFWRVKAYDLVCNQSNFSTSFYFIADVTPPIFFETTAWADTNYQGPYMVSSTITDYLAGVDSVFLYYRFDEGSWANILMDFQGGYYVGEIPKLNNMSTKIDYYLVARDLATNVATEPTGAPDTSFSFMYYVGITEKTNEPIPTPYLCESCPNPFANNTIISYQLPIEYKISLKIYNFAGQLVKTLIDGKITEEGYHSSAWDGTSDGGQKVVPGIYFCRLEANEFKITNKLILLH